MVLQLWAMLKIITREAASVSGVSFTLFMLFSLLHVMCNRGEPLANHATFHISLTSFKRWKRKHSYLQITKRKRWDDGMSAAFGRRGLAERPILGLKCLKPWQRQQPWPQMTCDAFPVANLRRCFGCSADLISCWGWNHLKVTSGPMGHKEKEWRFAVTSWLILASANPSLKSNDRDTVGSHRYA